MSFTAESVSLSDYQKTYGQVSFTPEQFSALTEQVELNLSLANAIEEYLIAASALRSIFDQVPGDIEEELNEVVLGSVEARFTESRDYYHNPRYSRTRNAAKELEESLKGYNAVHPYTEIFFPPDQQEQIRGKYKLTRGRYELPESGAPGFYAISLVDPLLVIDGYAQSRTRPYNERHFAAILDYTRPDQRFDVYYEDWGDGYELPQAMANLLLNHQNQATAKVA